VQRVDGRLDGIVVALDVDGVLLDTERGGKGSWQLAVADRFGVDPSELHRSFFERWWPEVIVGRVSIEEALGRVIAEESWPVSVDALLECWFEEDFWPYTELVSAARSWSERGARLALVTNQEHRRAAYVCARLGELLPLDQMVYSAGIGHVKSEAEFFVVATRMLEGVEAGQPIVFVDDAIMHVAVARRAGWIAVHFEVGSWPGRMEVALGQAASRG
jgi:putative hydrolase of the HAD superfamily